MRGATSCVLFSMLPLLAAGSDVHAVTVILDFRDQYSGRSLEIMKQETEGILKDSGLHLDWKLKQEAAHQTFPDLAVLRFTGSCILSPSVKRPEEFGTLAFTYVTDGAVQPFGEVSCDKIAAFLLSGLKNNAFYSDPARAMGVALGRVVAHELVHILLASDAHSREGVFMPALTVNQLTSGQMPLDETDLGRLRAAH